LQLPHYNRDKYKKKKDSPALFPGDYIPGWECGEEEPVRAPDIVPDEASKAYWLLFLMWLLTGGPIGTGG